MKDWVIKHFKELHEEIIMMGVAYGKQWIYYCYSTVIGSLLLLLFMIYEIIRS